MRPLVRKHYLCTDRILRSEVSNHLATHNTIIFIYLISMPPSPKRLKAAYNHHWTCVRKEGPSWYCRGRAAGDHHRESWWWSWEPNPALSSPSQTHVRVTRPPCLSASHLATQRQVTPPRWEGGQGASGISEEGIAGNVLLQQKPGVRLPASWHGFANREGNLDRNGIRKEYFMLP